MRIAIAALLCAVLGVLSLGTTLGTSTAGGLGLLVTAVILGAVAAGRALHGRGRPFAGRVFTVLICAVALTGAVLFLIGVSQAS